jgi:thiol-disulfide isomerase/thioredoxin
MLSVAFMVLLSGRTATSQDQKPIQVQPVRYAQLAELITKQRGKVVLVDFWGLFCPPCVKELPHVAQLHKKYAAQGLAVVSVSLDPIKKDPQLQQKVLQQLEKAEARMINLILDEDYELFQKKLHVEGPPLAILFNRQGKWVEFKEEQFRHDLIEAAVVQFLKEK